MRGKHLVRRHRSLAVGGGLLVVIGAGIGSFVGLRASSAPPSPPRAGGSSSTSTTTRPAVQQHTAFSVLSISPRSGSVGVSGSTQISITFSEPVSQSSPLPRVNPSVPGSWHVGGTRTLVFTPSQPFVPLSQVTLVVPAGHLGPAGTQGETLVKRTVDNFTVADGSTLRLQQLLSVLDYSPLAWTQTSTPIAATDTSAQLKAVYSPPAGRFSWRNSGWPSRLTALWRQGVYNVFTRGLVMEFQADHGLTVNGAVSAGLWNSLLQTVATGGANTGGYNYALANKAAPQTLTIWHNGRVVLQSSANTGIPQSPTASGTFPIFARYRNQVMKGTNPNGTSYADPVQFVAYFHGGDAVHYFPRAAYGIPQSLGCVELPLAAAAKAWPYLAYGTLVTVVN